MKGWKTLAVIGLLVSLGACAATQQAIIEDVMMAKDTEALLLKQSLCAMGVGAKNRVLSSAERSHVEGLCGGETSLADRELAIMRALGYMQGVGEARGR